MKMHLIFLSSLFVVKLWSNSFDAIKQRHQQFFYMLSDGNKLIFSDDYVLNSIDKHGIPIVNEILSWPKDNNKKIQLERLSALLSHPRRRSSIVFRTRTSHTVNRNLEYKINYQHKNFFKTLKKVIFLWKSNPEFAVQYPAITQALHDFFDIPKNNNNLAVNTINSFIYFPSVSNDIVPYHFYPALIDADRVHSIHLVSVEGGNKLTNAFGHSALMIAMCAPGQEMSDACLENTAFHLILAFRAEKPADEPLNPLRAATGGYPSRAVLSPLNDILSDYLDKQHRSVIAIPLKLDRTQINDFVGQLQHTIQAENRYDFFSINCATELLFFLQKCIAHHGLFKSSTLSPDGLIETVRKAGLIDYDLYERVGLKNFSWPLKKKNTASLMALEKKGLAFIPSEQKMRFSFKKLKIILRNYRFELDYTEEEFFSLSTINRIEEYKNIIQWMDDKSEEIGGDHCYHFIVLLRDLESEFISAHKKILNQEIKQFIANNDQSILSDKDEFFESEKSINVMALDTLEYIVLKNNSIFPVANNERQEWVEYQKEITALLSRNYHLKRQFKLDINHTLAQQEEFYLFLNERHNYYQALRQAKK